MFSGGLCDAGATQSPWQYLPSSKIPRHLSPVSGLLQLLVLYHFDPVVVRVEDEGDVLHSSVGKALLPVDLLLFQEGTGLVQVIYTHTNMTKSLGLVVAVVVHFAFFFLGAVIPGQLEQAFFSREWIYSVCSIGLFGDAVITWVTQEVQGEARLFLLGGPHQTHAHDVLVEIQTFLWVLDTDHGVVEAVGGGIGGGDILGLFHGFLANDLDPVAIWIEGEGNTPHAPVGQFLLKLVAGVFNTLACGLDVIDADADMTEAFVGFFVAVINGIGIVRLGAVIVGEFENAFAVGPMCAGRSG
jgi:hypothetical protein